MGLGKLIKEVRTINVYKKGKSKYLVDAVEEINIDTISLHILQSIVVANADDPMLYDGYILTQEQLDKLNNILKNKLKYDHKKFEYVLECYGIYE